MNWDLIADRWATMTHRLRRDRIEGLRNVGGTQEVRRAIKGGDGETSDKIPLDTIAKTHGNDHGLRSNQ